MPKGGDLHNHLTGAIYAESYLRWAAEDNLCLATATMSIVAATCDAAAGRPPVADGAAERGALQPGDRRDVDAALEPRAERPRPFLRDVREVRTAIRQDRRHARRGHGACGRRARELSRADADAQRLGGEAARPDGRLGRRPRAIARPPPRGRVPGGSWPKRAGGWTSPRPGSASCSDAAPATPMPGAASPSATSRRSGRAGVPEQVFAQMLAGFEIATQDPRFVGLNLVQPEDDPTAVRDFSTPHEDARFPARKVSATSGSRCTPASSSKGSCRRKRSASTFANRYGRGTRAASATAAASCTRTIRWGSSARWRRSVSWSRSRSAATI